MLKLDGCHASAQIYETGYPNMTKALNATGRPIVFSCSWPAYISNVSVGVCVSGWMGGVCLEWLDLISGELHMTACRSFLVWSPGLLWCARLDPSYLRLVWNGCISEVKYRRLHLICKIIILCYAKAGSRVSGWCISWARYIKVYTLYICCMSCLHIEIVRVWIIFVNSRCTCTSFPYMVLER